MSTTIDSLQIEINSSAQQAQSGIEALTASLNKLQEATKSSANLKKLGEQLRTFGDDISSISAMSVSTLTQLGAALNSLKGVESIKISSTIGKQLSEIATAGNAITTETIVNIQMLAPALQSLSSITDVQISPTIGTGISSIAAAVSQIDVAELSRINELANAIASLADIQNIQLSSGLATQIINLGIAAGQLQGVDLSVFGNLAEALHPLTELGQITNLTSAITQLSRLPEVISNLNSADLSTFTANIQALTNALTPLATQMNAVAAGFAALPARVQQLAQTTNTLSRANNTATGSYTDLYSVIRMLTTGIGSALKTIAKFVQSSNEYIEDINLFEASLGSYAKGAQEYAEKVGEVMGIDPAKWMRSQGVFYNLADGFGIASDRAYTMSQQLTQLAYDLSSFYNISADDAMLKIRGGLSGEIEMMRQLGVDLSNAAMQEKATAMGIQTKVTAMTQAEKAQLRYSIMMERTTTAQGDMARTLDAPANQLRVLSAQATQAGRALGNIFIPAINSILPVAIAATNAITKLLSAIAALFGYKLSTVDYSGGIDSTTSSVDGLTDSLNSAGGSAKKLKSYLMGFDELNVIDPNQGGGGGGGGSSSGLSDFNWDLYTYDFLGDAVNSRVNAITQAIEPVLNWLLENLEEVLAVAEAIGAAMLIWKIATALNPSLKSVLANMKSIASVALGLATIIITVALVFKSDQKYLATGEVGFLAADGIATALGTVLSGKIIGGVLGGKKGTYAAAIALSLSVATTLIATTLEVANGGITKETIISGLWSVIKGAAAGGVWAMAVGASVVTGIAVGAIITLSVALVLTLAAAAFNAYKLDKVSLWGDIALTADQIKQEAEKLLAVNVDTVVKLTNAQIQDEDTAVANLNAAITKFTSKINKIELGVKVSDTEVQSMIADITGENGIVAKVQKTLAEKEETVSLAVSLVPPKTTNGEDISASLLSAMGLGGSALNTAASDIGKRLASMIQQGMTTGFTSGENLVIAELSASLNRISTAVANGRVMGEFSASTELLLTDLTRESFTDVLSQYKTLEDNLRASYEALEKQAYADAVAYQAGLTEAQAYYASIGDTDNLAKVTEALASITAQIEQWDVGAAVDTAVDAATTDGRAKLLAAIQMIFAEPMSSVETSYWITDFISFFGTYDFSQDGSIDAAAGNLMATLSMALSSAMSAEDYKSFVDATKVLGITEWDALTTEIQQSLYDSIRAVYGDERTQEIFAAAGYDLTALLGKGFSENSDAIDTTIEDVLEGIDGVDVGATFVSDVVDTMTAGQGDITTAAETATSEVQATVDSALTDAETKLTEMTTNIGQAVETNVADTIDNSEQKIEAMSEAMDKTVKTTREEVSAAFLSLSDSVVAMMHGAYTSITGEWAGLPAWFVQRVTTSISNSFTMLKGSITTCFATAKTSVQSAWSGMGTWFRTNVANRMKSSLTDGWEDAGVTAMNNFIDGLKKVKMPDFHVEWNDLTKEMNGEKVTIKVPKLRFYAAGGFPTSGQMFVAREAGAEMVGNIGSRTAVVNNDQIVEAVSQGVYLAVRDAMSEGSNDANVTVYLDGEVVYRNQQKIAKKKGYNFVG